MLKFKSTTLNRKALLYKRFTNIEKSVGLQTVYSTPDGIIWYFDKELNQFFKIPSTTVDAVEYIESQGKSYIDLKYYPSDNTKVVLEFSAPIQNSGTLIGINGYNMYGYRVGFDFMNVGGNLSYVLDYRFDRSFGSTTLVQSSSKGTLEFSKDGLTYNGVSTPAFSPFYTTYPYTMFLFAQHNITTTTNDARNFTSAKIYGLNIYEGETLTRHFVPARDKKTGAYGLYDTITQETLISGNDVPLTGSEISSEQFSQPTNSTNIEVDESMVIQYKSLLYKYDSIDHEWRSVANGEGLTTLNASFDNIARYQTNKYYYVGSFDYMIKGSKDGTNVQYIKGNIIPLTSFNIKYFTDNLKIEQDDLVVIDNRLYSVENPETTLKMQPRPYAIHYATLNSIL